jgi:hypothetical protein
MHKPILCQPGDFFQRTRLLKEMCRARHDPQFLRAAQWLGNLPTEKLVASSPK